MSAPHATGHVKLMRRRRGDKFYAAVRANGSEFTRLIGPAWLKRSRPPEGHFTRSMAEEELARIMREVQHESPPRPTPSPTPAPNGSATSKRKSRSPSERSRPTAVRSRRG